MLQKAAETFLITEFTSKLCCNHLLVMIILRLILYILVINLIAIYAKRVTIQLKDMEFIEHIWIIMTGAPLHQDGHKK